MTTRREFLKTAGAFSLADVLKDESRRTRALAVLSRTISLVAQRSGAKIDLEKIPDKDAKTFALLRRGDTDGVFQFEDASARELLQRVRPESISDLVAITALNRPEPLSDGTAEAYISVTCGREEVAYQHPALEEILGETFGVTLYQEQVVLLLHRLGGIELSDGYRIFRLIGTNEHGAIDFWRARFLVGCRGRGVTEDLANDTYNKIFFFAGSCCCRAHAAIDAAVSYQAAFLGAHHPIEFAEAISTYH